MYMFGDETSPELPEDFKRLRQELAQHNSIFEDTTFEPTSIALTKLKGKVVWKRPFEITSNPRFIVDGATRFDVDQGDLGDCWFLAAVADLTLNQKLFAWVVPFDQDLRTTPSTDYAGIFLFRFWQYGRWEHVVIDDRLPTINNKLVYLRSADQNEFWPALLEKAYAKLYGSYKNIEAGLTTEALEDLCGGLPEYYNANNSKIFEIMSESRKRSSFMGASIISLVSANVDRSDGLIEKHAYSITDIQIIPNSDKRLVRLRNPWGNDAEWNGDWSDRSHCWNSVTQYVRNTLLDQKPDGEFWMQVEDFQRCFTFVDVCHLNPSSFIFSDEEYWEEAMFEGGWERGETAGGGYAHNKGTTFASNPQYFFSVNGDGSSETYAVVIELIQKDRRLHGKAELDLELDIFMVHPDQEQALDESFFIANGPVFQRKENRLRQLTVDVQLPPGTYCLIPCTYDSNEDASYFLRMYFEASAKVTIKKMDSDAGWGCNIL